jgi:hypothetical protein
VSLTSILPEGILFSGGTGRSGTTIIGKLLGRHSEIRASKPLEIKFLAANAGLLDLTFGRREFIEMKKRRHLIYRVLSMSKTYSQRELERKFRDRLRGEWWDGSKVAGKSPGLSSGCPIEVRESAFSDYMRDRRREPEAAAVRFFETMIRAQSNNKGERIWIDTSPPNIFNADRIHRLLPHAKFIHMKRDGRNTIASVLKEHWGPTDPLRAIYWWKNRVIASHKALERVPRESFIEIQLEEISHFDRENQYLRLLSFVGLDDDAAMRAFFEREVDGQRVIQARWREEISEPLFEARFRAVHRELEELGISTALYD